MDSQNIIIQWFNLNKRDLPWRKNSNAFHVWLSETILQQTKIEQGLNYFIKFTENYSSITELANDKEENVLKLWQGLGYYSRARNLHASSKIIRDQYNGVFPSDYSSIIKLKGIGEYTAAAISTFAFSKPLPLVDGNVYRLYSRLYNIDTEINTTAGKKEFYKLAETLLQELSLQEQKIYNEAIMEFGALVCKPKKPQCAICPIQDKCLGFALDRINVLPKKKKSSPKRKRYFNFFFLETEDGFYINQRKEKDIWENLHQLPLKETDEQMSLNLPNLFACKHILSHQIIHINIYRSEDVDVNNSQEISWDEWDKLAYPQPIFNFLNELKKK